MKIFTIILVFTFCSVTVFSQNCSTINFVTKKSKGRTYAIYLNQQLVGTIGHDENLEFKICSEGRISVIILMGMFRTTASIDIKNGNTYYMEIKGQPSMQAKVVDKKIGEELFNKNATTIHGEEDIKNPIGKLPIK